MEPKLPPTMFPQVAKGQRADKPAFRNGPQFLCSQCETEQNVLDIRQGSKVCLCPNCEANCCADYCTNMGNGKWYPPEPDMFLPSNTYDNPKNAREEKLHNEAYDTAERLYKEAYEAFSRKYQETKRSYGVV